MNNRLRKQVMDLEVGDIWSAFPIDGNLWRVVEDGHECVRVGDYGVFAETSIASLGTVMPTTALPDDYYVFIYECRYEAAYADDREKLQGRSEENSQYGW